MTLRDLLAALATRLNNPDVSLNDAGVCRLVLDNRLGISIEKTVVGEGAILYAVIAHVPDDNREALYARLLGAQLYAREIGEGCAFGLDDYTGEIVLSRKLSLERLDPDTFYRVLNEFANWTDYWTERLSSSESAGQPASHSEVGHELSPSHFIRA